MYVVVVRKVTRARLVTMRSRVLNRIMFVKLRAAALANEGLSALQAAELRGRLAGSAGGGSGRLAEG